MLSSVLRSERAVEVNNPDFNHLEFEGFGNRAAEGNIRDQGRYSAFGAANGGKCRADTLGKPPPLDF
jgi:hypothetical protein